MQETLAQAGLNSVTPTAIVASSVGLALVVMVVVYVISLSSVVAIAFGLLAACTPTALVRRRQRQRRQELRDLWPDIVDNLASAVRAGMSLPEALTQLADRGPEALRPAFRRFGEDYRATGRFDGMPGPAQGAACRTGGRPNRRVAAHRSRGRRLRSRSAAAHAVVVPARGRSDQRRSSRPARLDGQCRAAGRRRAVAGARHARRLRPEAVDAYDSAAGVVVLAVGGVVCFVAYRAMLRIGKLPEEERVLR